MKPSWTQRFEEKAVARGRAEGIAWSILALLQKRGLAITEEQRLALSHCQDLEQLEGWLLRAADVASVGELLPSALPQTAEKEDELAVAETKVEEAYQALEELLSQRVVGHSKPVLEANIQAQFEVLAQRKQERAEALERAYQQEGPTALDELKSALEEARKLVKESEEANATQP